MMTGETDPCLRGLPCNSGPCVRSAKKWRRGFQLRILTAGICSLLPVAGWATGDFYEAPLQTLADYLRLDQLPAKTTDQIFEETAKERREAKQPNYAKELLALMKKPGPQALAGLDALIAAARAGARVELLTVLHDIRDVLAGPANAAESQAYIEWRIEQADHFGASLDPAKPPPDVASPPPLNPELVADIERHSSKASAALKPHWLYLRGAVEYRSHNIAESQPYFEKVVKEFPKSPRAEFALYMAMRCQFWRSRSPEYDLNQVKVVPAERGKLKKLLDEYVAKYPKGRLMIEVLGWSGAYAYDGQDYGSALRYYGQQLDLAKGTDLAPLATQNIERTLSHLASRPNDKGFAEVAKHPEAAQALVYILINTAESDNYNGKIDSIDEVRGWRKKVLPRLAAAISAESKLYQGAQWKPRYLAMLAYAASGAGQQDQALKLLESAGSAVENSDDLLMARGVVLHRAKQPKEAATALQMLLEKFPKSPLAAGGRLRLGLALTDDHRAGEAVLALNPLLPVPKNSTPQPAAADAKGKPANAAAKSDDATPGAEKADPDAEPPDEPDAYRTQIHYGIDLDQVRALIDALLNFAPVEELAATAHTPGIDPVLRLQLTEPIAQRLLAKEQFAEAKQYMTPAQFGLIAAGLEKLTTAARDTKDPAARAAACLKLGDAWAAARGKLLTYPLDTQENRRNVFIDYSAEADVRRADSAPFVGATGNYKLDLENRDELRHAFNWWLESSDAQTGTPQTAQALWRALNAMPQIADVSPYTFDRAVSRKWGDVARKLYDRLRSEIPDSLEAKRYAVAWDFPAPRKKKNDEYVPIHRGTAGSGILATDAFGIEEVSSEGRATEALNDAIASLEGEAVSANPAKARAKAESLRKQVREAFPGLYDARWVNLVDDLALFLSEPDPGAEIRKRYVALRYRFLNKSAIGGNGFEEDAGNPDGLLEKDIAAALADPATKPVADYFEFLHLAVLANHFVFIELKPRDQKKENLDKEEDTYRSRDYPALAKATQAFLEKYPKSKKREAAMLLHARAVYRSSEEVALKKSVTWPRATRWEGGNEPTLTQQETFEAKRVFAALDAYDKAFPQGRYAADIRGYRAAVALRMHDWISAIDLSLAQLTGHENPGLNSDAATCLGAVFAQLADEHNRADILAAVKANKRAKEMLEKYVAFESDTHPLLYMKGWLREQLASSK